VTEILVNVTIDKYEGLIHGRNGIHEVATAHITQLLAVAKPQAVDSQKLSLALNVRSHTDPSGLPNEIVLSPGQTIQLEGEYIPAKRAGLGGHVAVIHFTHSPGGFVVIDGHTYS
jgi:hypothetical protein